MSILMNRRRGVGKKANLYLMTKDTNPEVLAICYAQGWCASPDYMTYEEASAVTDIGTAFTNNTAITHFDELEYFGIKRVPAQAFYKCSNLTRISLPNITEIMSKAFNSCQQLSIIDIPDSVTSIGGDSFAYSGLNVVKIGSGIMSIASWAFSYLRNLVNVTIRASIPPSIISNTFRVSDNAIFYVPENSVDAYKTDVNWSDLADRIQAIPNI